MKERKIEKGFAVNMLTVISDSFVKDKYNIKYYKCKCLCGNERYVTAHEFKKGIAVSCGCSRKKENPRSKQRLYNVWINMRKRCNNKNDKRYGGREIFVCQEWYDDYEAFKYFAIKNGYDDTKEIDRINNNDGYYPENCRFVTHLQNGNNRDQCVLYNAFGEEKTLRYWSLDERCEPSYGLLRARTSLGWSVEAAITTPVKANPSKVEEGVVKSIKHDLKSGYTNAETARRNNVSDKYVHKIKKRDIRKNI